MDSSSERELGQGATAKALLVTKDDKEFVLKVALTEDDNARLHEEAEALRTIHSEFIVAIEQELTMNGRTVLVLQKAGDKTLAALLAKEGVPSLDLLSRYGDDLLSALASLERHGVVHRDIKPDNIGIRSLTKQRNQLILFDFSLARAPLENINVGTEGYRDPFLKLRKPPRWDLAAERYSAAVTLYEMTLGHGVLPQWGSDKSDPGSHQRRTGDRCREVRSQRAGRVGSSSSRKALNREPGQRFDNAYDMQTAWRQVFKEAEQRKITTPTGEEVDLGVSLDEASSELRCRPWDSRTRARNALERANVITVRDLLKFPISDIHLMRGVGNQTRQEIIRFVGELREKFPNVEAIKPKDQSPVEILTDRPAWKSCTIASSAFAIPRRKPSGSIRAGLLGVTAPESQPASQWPSQTDVAEALLVTRARIGQVVVGGSKSLEQRPPRHGLPPRTVRANPATRRRRHDR